MIKIEGNTTTDRNQWLRNLLKSGTYNITFTKVNGEQRTMPCTLEPTKLPPAPVKEAATKARKDDTLSVWCLDKQEWRSFKVMNVIEITEYSNV